MNSHYRGERARETQTDRHTDRQTHTDIQTEPQTHRADIQTRSNSVGNNAFMVAKFIIYFALIQLTYRHSHRQTDTQTDRHRHTVIHTQTETNRDIHTHTYRQTYIHTDIHTY